MTNEKVIQKLRSLLDKNLKGETLCLEEVEDTMSLIRRLENGEEAAKSLEEGDQVVDESPPSYLSNCGIPNEYTVVEVTDKESQDVIARPAKENPENHPKSVSDLNPGYPEDDKVVKVSPKGRDAIYAYPRQRLRIREPTPDTISPR